jgi:hypothetical protein
MLRYILSLLLIFTIGTPAYGDTLVKRYKYAEEYQVNAKTRKLIVGGGISNAKPFDHDGPMEPQSYKWSDVEQIAPSIYRLKRGDFGYTVYKDTGEIRVHPVRKHWDVYWSIASKNPVSLSHRQVNDKLLELYVDTNQVRYSFFIGDMGFKINNRLKASYSGGDEWSYTYNVALVGMTRQGRELFYNGVAVGNLPDPFMQDANGRIAPVVETLEAGQLTLSISNINGFVLPIDVDPTLGPINSGKDAFILENPPLNGYGQREDLLIDNRSGTLTARVVEYVDISSIAGTITNATHELYHHVNAGGPSQAGVTLALDYLNQSDFTTQGSATPNAECNWINYKGGASPVAWPVGNGAADIDSTFQSTVALSAIDTWTAFDITDMAEDARVNHNGDLSVRLIFQTEDLPANGAREGFRSLDYIADPTKRPKWTFIFDGTLCSWRLDQFPPIWCY